MMKKQKKITVRLSFKGKTIYEEDRYVNQLKIEDEDRRIDAMIRYHENEKLSGINAFY